MFGDSTGSLGARQAIPDSAEGTVAHDHRRGAVARATRRCSRCRRRPSTSPRSISPRHAQRSMRGRWRSSRERAATSRRRRARSQSASTSSIRHFRRSTPSRWRPPSSESLARLSFTMIMLGVAAAVTLALGVVGLYGVIAYIVTLRTRELGVRIALGAQPSSVAVMVARQGLLLSAVRDRRGHRTAHPGRAVRALVPVRGRADGSADDRGGARSCSCCSRCSRAGFRRGARRWSIRPRRCGRISNFAGAGVGLSDVSGRIFQKSFCVRQSPGPHGSQAEHLHPRLVVALIGAALGIFRTNTADDQRGHTRQSSLDRSFTVDQTRW